MSAKPEKEGVKVVCLNRKARFNYFIIETFEAGLVLTGPEIKSIRRGDISISESYVGPYAGELFLIGAHIKPYSFSSAQDYDPLRKRKLLMKKHEIEKLRSRVEEAGLTLVPLQIHLKRGFAKLEIALAKGKQLSDKRDTIKERDSKREIARAMSRK